MRLKRIKRSTKKGVIHSLGCKVNQIETESVAQLMRELGFELDQSTDQPDLIFINTCCVTGRAEAKSRRFVGRIAKTFPQSRIMVSGCLAELKPDDLRSLGPNIECLGTFQKNNLGENCAFFLNTSTTSSSWKSCDCLNFGSLPTPVSQARSRAFLKIQDGCSQRCSYCIVPSTRGPSRSMDLEKAVRDLASLERADYPEIVLTGIHLGAYGRDLEPATTLDAFVVKALSQLKSSRLRLSSIEPQEISDSLIEMVSRDGRLCKHFHIPFQSLDDKILQLMGRPYGFEKLNELVRKILKMIPTVCIGADIMVGFPGEDEDSFKFTYDALGDLGLAYLHVFPFSPRPGAPASKMNGIPNSKIVSHRVSELRKLSARLRGDFYKKFIGCELEACLEAGSATNSGQVLARTNNYILAELDESRDIPPKRLFKIVIESSINGNAKARLSRSLGQLP